MTTPPRLCIHDVERARTDGWRADARAVAIRMGWNPDTIKMPWRTQDLPMMRDETRTQSAFYSSPYAEPQYIPVVEWDGSISERRRERAAKEARP